MVEYKGLEQGTRPDDNYECIFFMYLEFWLMCSGQGFPMFPLYYDKVV